MSLFEGLDQIERSLYSPARNFDLKVHVKVSHKSTKDGRRMDAAFFKRFSSKKYSDESENVRLSLSFSEFLVLTYSTGEKGGLEEVFLSYPHIPRFMRAVRDCTEAVFETGAFFEGDNGAVHITPEAYAKVFKVSGLANGKSIALRPEVLSSADGDEAGAALYINGMARRVELKHESLESLDYFLQRFNLLDAANSACMLGALAVAGDSVPPPPPASVITEVKRRGK